MYGDQFGEFVCGYQGLRVNYGNTYGFEQLMALVPGLQTLPRMLKKNYHW